MRDSEELNKNIKDEMVSILAEILDRDPEEITLDARFVEDLGMDSIMSVEIIAATEKKFKIVIPDEEIQKIATLRQAIALAKEYLAKKEKKGK